MLTVTGAWSRLAAIPGWASRTVIATVSWPPPFDAAADPPPAGAPLAAGAGEEPPEGVPWSLAATAATEDTTPGVVVVPSGRVTLTASPALTRYSWLTGSAASTT